VPPRGTPVTVYDPSPGAGNLDRKPTGSSPNASHKNVAFSGRSWYNLGVGSETALQPAKLPVLYSDRPPLL
jgi:hypothetical protein